VVVTYALELSDLRFSYPDGSEALRGIDLRVAEGECVGLIGPNGAGKSTLLLHLNGILPEFGGRRETAPSMIRVFGEPISSANLGSIRRAVGLLFQDPDDQLFCPTVFEDVAFGPRQFGLVEANVREAVTRALAMVGLAGFETRAPHRLSVGEKRRVCLAGILACEPRILVLDEPTSNLDPRGRRELKALLAAIPATKIIATHDLELVVQLCTRAVVLDGGKIAADGPPVDLLADEPLMLAHGLERPHVLQHRHPH
jgi:cobalt/nickel transport system ATP-binding protein